MIRTIWPLRVRALLLRDPAPGDVERLLAFRNDPLVNRFMIRTHVEPEVFRHEMLSAPDSATDFSCVAELDGEVVAVGFLDVVDGTDQPGGPRGTEAVVGYVIDPQHWGRGIGRALAEGLLQAAFERLEVRRVTAACTAANLASVRILESIGMRREKHGRGDSWHQELGWVDGYEYALLKTEYQCVSE